MVTADVARDLLAGLEGHGVVGLSLVPEGLRHPFAFAKALLGPTDYVGTTIRAPRSDVSFAILAALGAQPQDLTGPDFDLAVAGSSVTAAESEYVLAASLPARSVATGNVTFYPKADALVVNADVLRGLDDDQRDVLRQAAERTTRWAIAATQTDAEAASAYCAQGGAVVLATADDVAALEQAAAPVRDDLERDPATAALITAIRKLKPAVAPSVRPCGTPPDGSVTPLAGARQSTPIDGVYRAELGERELTDRGMAAQDASDNSGLIRLTFDRGALVMSEERGRWPDCHAVYSVAGDRLQILVTGPGCPRETKPLVSRWRMAAGALRLTPIDPTDPFTRIWWGASRGSASRGSSRRGRSPTAPTAGPSASPTC